MCTEFTELKYLLLFPVIPSVSADTSLEKRSREFLSVIHTQRAKFLHLCLNSYLFCFTASQASACSQDTSIWDLHFCRGANVPGMFIKASLRVCVASFIFCGRDHARSRSTVWADNSSGGSRWQGRDKKSLEKEYETEMDGSVKVIRRWSVKLQTTEDKSNETSAEQRSVQEGSLKREQGFNLNDNTWIHV